MDFLKEHASLYLNDLVYFIRGQSIKTNIVLAIGAFTALKLAYSILDFIFLYNRPSNLRDYLHETRGKPAWALVTGASDGIGKHLSHELAATGFNVVLHGRNEAKLRGVQAELEKAFPNRSFRLLIADVSTVPCTTCVDSVGAAKKPGGALDIDALVAPLDELNLTVVINNAGGGPPTPTYGTLQDQPRRRILDNVSLNALFPMMLLHALLPQLARDGPALVINISSLATMGLPLLSYYAASKCFLVGLSQTLAREARLHGGGTGVDVLAVTLGAATGVSHTKTAPTLFEPSSEVMARAILGRVGCGRLYVVAYWAHALQQIVVESMPSFVMESSYRDVMLLRQEAEREELSKNR